jgi:hypothetical protein
LLSDDEQELLHRRRDPDVARAPWTEADLALVDEADSLLGAPESARPRRSARRRPYDDTADRVVAELGVGGFITGAELARRDGGEPAPRPSAPVEEEPRTFGHVLVDEAQDLSPMQWRMLARRCPTGSLTIVGDFGQSSRPGAARSWDEVLALLPIRADPRVVTLTVNYRTPAEVMEVAHRVLAVAAPDVAPTRAVRHTGEYPRFVRVAVDEVVRATAAAARAVVGDGTVAVVAPKTLHDEIVDALSDVGAVADSAEALDAAVAVLGPTDAKGLEFDHVVLVEPAQLLPDEPAGLRLLYVVLTRATRRLVVIHSEPLPPPLASAARSLGGAPVAAS